MVRKFSFSFTLAWSDERASREERTDMRSREFLWLFLLLQVRVHLCSFSITSCNVTESCWFHPPGCTENNRNGCLSAVKWNMEPDGLNIWIESVVSDLDQSRPFYAAVGFSYNQKMNDDTVFECVQSQTGRGVVQMSFNDMTYNELMPQASSVMLENTSSVLEDGILSCSGKILLDNRNSVDEAIRFKVHDLESQPYYLLFARGNADVFTLEKDIHSVNDNAQFPWTSNEMVTFCRFNCTSSNQMVIVSDMKQNDISRYWRYRIAVMHGAFLLLAWWVLGSSAILMARYFKPMFPRTKLLGTAVWFQLHRDMFITSLILQLLAVFFIFYQAGWVWYECSYKCTSDNFSLKMHAITGFGATALALFQPFFAFLRPAPDSSRRPWFNWGHWLVGMTAWTLASVTFVLALPLGKTGLNAVYGRVPNWIMGGYIAFFLFCNVLLEMIASSNQMRSGRTADLQPHSYTIGPNGMALANVNGPSKESPLAPDTRSHARLFIFFAHLIVSLGVAITITTMLVKILLSHSP